MSAVKKENSDAQSTARIAAHRQAGPPLATWLAALLLLLAAFIVLYWFSLNRRNSPGA